MRTTRSSVRPAATALAAAGLVAGALLAAHPAQAAPTSPHATASPAAASTLASQLGARSAGSYVDRSGASIVGALLLGADKRSATEFSFFLAMPTMAGAFAYDLYKNYAGLTFNDVQSIALGFVVAFISGVDRLLYGPELIATPSPV